MTPVRLPETREASERLEADTSEALTSHGDRPSSRPKLGAVIASRWLLVLACAMLSTGVGLGIAFTRAPTYTAETRLTVGSIEEAAEQVPGYVEAARQLASSYSRLAESDIILVQVARETGTPLDTVQERVLAAPIPDSPVLRIETHGDSRGEAIRLADVIGRELRDYVGTGQAGFKRSGAALREFRRWSRLAIRLESRLEQLRQRRQRRPGSVSLNLIQSTRASAEVARLRAQGASAAYSDTRQRGQDAARLSVLQQPRSADSDRFQIAQQLGFLGLLGGVLVGVALASLLGARRWRQG